MFAECFVYRALLFYGLQETPLALPEHLYSPEYTLSLITECTKYFAHCIGSQCIHLLQIYPPIFDEMPTDRRKTKLTEVT